MNDAEKGELYEDLLWSFTGRIARMTDSELLSKATSFDVGPEPFINGHPNVESGGKFWWSPREGEPPLEVEYRYHVQVKFTGSKWVIHNGLSVLNKLGEWEHSPMPSSQEEEFRNRTRFDSACDAIIFFRRWRRIIIDAYETNKHALKGRALFDEIDRIVAEEFKQGPLMF